MIKGLFHPGSGLGNQLHRYVGTKIIALEDGEGHTMIGQEFFKGKDTFDLDLLSEDIEYTVEYPAGRVVPESYEGVIDGEFQAEKDFYPHIDQIKEWLRTEPVYDPYEESEHPHAPICVINFRGGEYVGVPDLFLPQEYWDKAIEMMLDNDPEIEFLVVTDDPIAAREFFPDFDISHDENDWRMIRDADALILSNSSFAILPAYLNENDPYIIAPKYWARYNTKEWINPDNATYSKFTYIHHEQD